MAFGRPALTLAGKTLMAKVLAGDTLKFTKMKMGDGSLSGSNPAELSDLINPVATITAENVKKGSNYIAVKGTFSNAEMAAGFYWREFGIFAQDKDRGEILFAYANAGELADYIAAAATSEIVKTLTAVIAVADTENISVTLDTSIVYASAEDLDKLTQIIEKLIGEKIPDSGSGETIVINSSGVITLTHTYTTPTHAFTGLGNRTGLIPAQFKATAGYTEGDTATIDGESYTIQLTGADAPETDLFTAGKSVLVDIDTEGKTINFKAGGGLTGGKLGLATAEESEVFAGKTFYAGDKQLRTGTALSTPITATVSDTVKGKTYYDQTGALKTGTREPFVVKNQIILEDTTWTVPDGVTKVFVRIFGGGGGGGARGGYLSGGGAGGHMATGTFEVTPGQQIPITIGAGGQGDVYNSYGSGTHIQAPTAGGTSSFGALLSATGGGIPGLSYKGADGGTGGGSNAIGGNGSYGGGGGGGSFKYSQNGVVQTSYNKGGNGGTYGGGGGGGATNSSDCGGGGAGGTYGGKGGGGNGENGTAGTDTTGMGLDYTGTGNGGSSDGYGYGGGGGGGYGGNGGNSASWYSSGTTFGYGGGGGGGYGGNGGKGYRFGGGGGGYGGNGGNGSYSGGGGGGGYGKNGNGGDGGGEATIYGNSQGAGGDAVYNGGIAAGGGGGHLHGGSGGSGICIITYLE